MKRYRKKEVVEAVQWFKMGDHSDVIEIPEKFNHYYPVRQGAIAFLPNNQDGGRFVFVGDYIIKDSYGDVYCYDKELFEKLYEEINEEPICTNGCDECEHESSECVNLDNNN